jgi:hypothetical protein
MPKCLLALALGLIGDVLVGYLASGMLGNLVRSYGYLISPIKDRRNVGWGCW